MLSRARELPPVVVCGPIAAAGEPARGGYQACNRRTIDALRAAGADVRALPFPHPRSRGVAKAIAYAAGFARLYAEVARCAPGSIFHLTALSTGFMYAQWPLVKLARSRGCRVVFDVRAGGAPTNYRMRSPLYRRVTDSALRSADLCLVEGLPFVDFFAGLSGRPTAHLPNHLDTARVPPRDDRELPLAPTVVYVGRIVAAKGIETMLQACRTLHARGLAVRVAVAGDGDARYVETLRRSHPDVEWLGALGADDVMRLLARAHFFVLPSRHFGEGQSNALTEALACGCVPIASRHGFAEAVVGEAGVTLPTGAPADAYTDAVLRIWREPLRWRALSRAARERAQRLYATPSVVGRLVEHYLSLARERGAAHAHELS